MPVPGLGLDLVFGLIVECFLFLILGLGIDLSLRVGQDLSYGLGLRFNAMKMIHKMWWLGRKDTSNSWSMRRFQSGGWSEVTSWSWAWRHISRSWSWNRSAQESCSVI